MTRIRKSAQQKSARNRRRSKQPPRSRRHGVSRPEAGVFPADGTPADEEDGPDLVANRIFDEEHDGDGDLDDLEFDPNVRDILGDFGLDDEEAVPEAGDFWFEGDDDLED